MNVPIDRLLCYLLLWKLHGVWLSFGGIIRVVTDDAKNLEDMVDRAAAIAFCGNRTAFRLGMRFGDGNRVDVVIWSIDFVCSSEKVAFMVEHLMEDPLLSH